MSLNHIGSVGCNGQSENPLLIVQCPKCSMHIIIAERNCSIFRCGIYRDSYQQIPPHLDKESCLNLVTNKSIYGCGSPFILVGNIAQNCDYI